MNGHRRSDHEPAAAPPKPDWALGRHERRAAERAALGLPAQRRRWPLVLLLIVLAGGWWYALGGGAAMIEALLAGQQGTDARPSPAPAPVPEAAPADVQVVQLANAELLAIRPATLRETVKVTGSLDPWKSVHLAAQIAGRIESVEVRAGDPVQAGDMLVHFDPEPLETELRQQLANAEATRAQLRLAEAQLERIRGLVERGLSPPSELEVGQASVEQLRASLLALETRIQTAERSLGEAAVAAPFAGTVAEISVDSGGFVTASAPLLTLVDLHRMEFVAALPVRYAPLIRPGMRVEMTVEGMGGTVHVGEIARISPVAVAGTRMLPVYVALDNPGGVLRGGMFASGDLVLEAKTGAIGVPVGAVLDDAGGQYVLKLADERLERQPVTVARLWEGGRMAEIALGLSRGDVIVGQQLSGLRPGARVQMVD